VPPVDAPLRCFCMLEDVGATITSTALTLLHEVAAHRDQAPKLDLAHPRDAHLGLGDERVVGERWRRGDAMAAGAGVRQR
jgi:hypothetical protein